MKGKYITHCCGCGKKLLSDDKRGKTVLCGKCRKQRKDYTPDFQLIKLAIIARDGNKCLCCLRTIKLLVHHIDRNRLNNKPDNLMTLCNQCHLSLHGHYAKKPTEFKRKMKVRSFPKVDYQKYGVRLVYPQNTIN